MQFIQKYKSEFPNLVIKAELQPVLPCLGFSHLCLERKNWSFDFDRNLKSKPCKSSSLDEPTIFFTYDFV